MAVQGALPTYLRIAEALTIDIAAGRLAAGEKLPPERQMAKAQGVTVTTLRKSLKILEDRDLLERRQGSGNYVRAGETGLGTYALFRLEAVPEGGGLPTAELLSLTRRKKPADLPDLGSRVSEAWNIRRLRALNHQPVAVEDIWLDGRFEGPLCTKTVSESLYKTYRESLGLVISRAEDRVTLGPLPDWAPDALNAAPRAIMGLVKRRAFDGYGAVAEISTTWFDPARAAYVARIP